MRRFCFIFFAFLLLPVYGQSSFSCLPQSVETLIYCNDLDTHKPFELSLYADIADTFVFKPTIYDGTGTGNADIIFYYTYNIYNPTTSYPAGIEIVGLNLISGSAPSTYPGSPVALGIYIDANNPNSHYAIALYNGQGSDSLEYGTGIIGLVFDARDAQGRVYDEIQVEFDVAPSFYANQYGIMQIDFPVWPAGEIPVVGVGLFDGEKVLKSDSVTGQGNVLESDAVDFVRVSGSPAPNYTPNNGVVSDYPVTFKTVSATLSTSGVTDPNGKVTLLLGPDSTNRSFHNTILIDNIKVMGSNRANPNSASSIPSLTFIPLLVLMGLFGWLTSCRLKRC